MDVYSKNVLMHITVTFIMCCVTVFTRQRHTTLAAVSEILVAIKFGQLQGYF